MRISILTFLPVAPLTGRFDFFNEVEVLARRMRKDSIAQQQTNETIARLNWRVLFQQQSLLLHQNERRRPPVVFSLFKQAPEKSGRNPDYPPSSPMASTGQPSIASTQSASCSSFSGCAFT